MALFAIGNYRDLLRHEDAKVSSCWLPDFQFYHGVNLQRSIFRCWNTFDLYRMEEDLCDKYFNSALALVGRGTFLAPPFLVSASVRFIYPILTRICLKESHNFLTLPLLFQEQKKHRYNLAFVASLCIIKTRAKQGWLTSTIEKQLPVSELRLTS